MAQRRQPDPRVHHASPVASVAALDRHPGDHYVLLHDSSPTTKATRLAESKRVYSLTTAESIAIPVAYLCVGVLMSFPSAYIEYFPRTKDASDAQLSTVSVVRSLPWSIKVLFGILPDNFPIKQLRFKPYMIMGFALSSFFNALISWYSESLSVVSFTMLLFGSMIGTVLADVMGDALVTSRVLKKQEASAGHVQSTVYLCRYLSEMLGYWGGALLSNPANWDFGLSMSQVFGVVALAPVLTVLPCIYFLEEPTAPTLASWSHQRQQLWTMLQRRATWQPLCFLALFNALLLHNSAWGNYLTVAYHFDAFQYGMMSAISASVTFVSVFVYRHFVMLRVESPWHTVYLVTGVIVAIFSVLNVLLVLRVNDSLGIPPFWFSVGDTAVISFAKGLQQLPVAVMLVAVCPENQEGVAYALLTSMTNLSHAFAHTISNMLLRIWPVELPDLRTSDFSGVWKLTVLTSCVSVVPLFFLKTLLPRGKKEQVAMRDELSERGAWVVMVLYLVGFVWVLSLSFIAIIQPCNVLVGGHGCGSE